MAGGDVIELGGYRFRDDHGIHGIWSPYRNLQAMLARHSIRPVFVPAQEESWIYKRVCSARTLCRSHRAANAPRPADTTQTQAALLCP